MRYTKYQMLEFIKCMDEPNYFIEKYLMPEQATLCPLQKLALNAIRNKKKVCIRGRRQIGITSLLQWEMTRMMVFERDKTLMFVSRIQSVSSEILLRVKTSLEKLPEMFDVEFVTKNMGRMEMKSGMVLLGAGIGSTHACRGRTISGVFMDNVGFYSPRDMDDFMACLWPTVTAGSAKPIVMASTDEGSFANKKFYDFCTKASKHESEFTYVEMV